MSSGSEYAHIAAIATCGSDDATVLGSTVQLLLRELQTQASGGHSGAEAGRQSAAARGTILFDEHGGG